MFDVEGTITSEIREIAYDGTESKEWSFFTKRNDESLRRGLPVVVAYGRKLKKAAMASGMVVYFRDEGGVLKVIASQQLNNLRMKCPDKPPYFMRKIPQQTDEKNHNEPAKKPEVLIDPSNENEGDKGQFNEFYDAVIDVWFEENLSYLEKMRHDSEGSFLIPRNKLFDRQEVWSLCGQKIIDLGKFDSFEICDEGIKVKFDPQKSFKDEIPSECLSSEEEDTILEENYKVSTEEEGDSETSEFEQEVTVMEEVASEYISAQNWLKGNYEALCDQLIDMNQKFYDINLERVRPEERKIVGDKFLLTVALGYEVTENGIRLQMM